jgi:tetratricopeptide (TPR) repeat protein
MKAMTNYAVTLEKLGKRVEALELLDQLKDNFKEEIRIYNNLGIVSKRNGNISVAEANFEAALKIDNNNFFPNYNLAILKASLKD